MKKFCCLFLSSVFATLCCLSLFACDEKHFHEFKSFDTPPTCLSKGKTTYVCECGERFSIEYGEKLNHVFTDYVYDDNAACGKNGTETAYCDYDCGTKDVREKNGTALAHSFTNYVETPPTCKKNGYKVAYCDHGCGATDVIEHPGTRLSHSFTDYKETLPTCTENGYKTAYCDHGCGETHKVSGAPALGHDYDTNHICTRCGRNEYIDFKLNEAGDGYILTNCAYGGDYRIPETYNGLPVTGIGKSAFAYNTAITGVTMGNNVKTIDGWAFFNCKNLKSVTLSDDLVSVGRFAFYACDKLSGVQHGESFYLPSNSNPYFALYKAESTIEYTVHIDVKIILSHAISNKNVQTIYLPNGLRYISGYAVSYCTKLESIYYDCTVTVWGAVIEGAIKKIAERVDPKAIDGCYVKTIYYKNAAGEYVGISGDYVLSVLG